MQNSISPPTSTRLHRNVYEVIQSYVQLTKPRIIVLLLVTTGAAVFLASEGQVDPVVLLATLLGGWLAAAAANTINCLYDRDIDQIMERTSLRPLPSGRVRVRDAMIFAGVLAGLSFILLNTVTNLLAALFGPGGDCLLCADLHPLVEASFDPKYRHWRRGGGDSPSGGLGRCDG